MASRIATAAGSSHQANTVGPAPEIEQPIAPLAIAAACTAAKPGISAWRCGSMTTSAKASRSIAMSSV